MPYLRIARNGEPQGEVELTGDVVGIGRDPGNDIPLVDPDKWVSRFHAEIRHDEHAYTVADLGTTNGLTVDGEAINEAVLVDGTQIAIGPFTLEFRLSRAAGPVPSLASAVSPPAALAPTPAPTLASPPPPTPPLPSPLPLPLPPAAAPSAAAVSGASRPPATRGRRRIQGLLVAGIVLLLVGVGALVTSRRTDAPPAPETPTEVRQADPQPPVDSPAPADLVSPLLAEARLRYDNSDLTGADDKVTEILQIDATHALALVLQGEIAAKRREQAGPTGTRRGAPPPIRIRPDILVRGDDTQASYDRRADEIADVVREIDQSLAQRQMQRALEGVVRLRRIEPSYTRTAHYEMEARRPLVEEAIAGAERNRLRWSSVETSLDRAGQLAGGLESLRGLIEEKRSQLLASNQRDARELLSVGNQHLASNKKAEATPVLEQITRMLPSTDPLHVQALDFLRTIR